MRRYSILVLLNFFALLIAQAAGAKALSSGEAGKVAAEVSEKTGTEPLKLLSGEERSKAQEEISKASKEIKTLKADFVQSKSVAIMDGEQKSEGKMYFSEGMLRWEYTSPNQSVFIVNGQKVLTKSDRGVTSTSLSSGRGFSGIAGVIMKCVTGDLDDSSQFRAEYYSDNDGRYTVALTPLKRDVKKLFSSFTLNFDKSLRVRTVEMTESGGGVTSITIVNPVINAPLDKKIFDID